MTALTAEFKITAGPVWYVPELGVNLFSLIVAEMKGYSICAENSQIKLVHNDVVVVDECVSRLGLVC